MPKSFDFLGSYTFGSTTCNGASSSSKTTTPTSFRQKLTPHVKMATPTRDGHSRDMLTLETLPEEICIDIVEWLDLPSVLALSRTNHFFQRVVWPTKNSRRTHLQDLLLEAQTLTRWKGAGLACFACLTVLPLASFATAQVEGKRGANGTHQRKRFCIECGVGKGLYAPGNYIFPVGVGEAQVICRKCKRLSRRGSPFCHVCSYCEDCESSYLSQHQRYICEGLPGHAGMGLRGSHWQHTDNRVKAVRI